MHLATHSILRALLALGMALSLSSCWITRSGQGSTYWGEWEIVEPEDGEQPAWVDRPSRGAVVGVGRAIDMRIAQRRANQDMVKAAASTVRVRVQNIAVRVDTEDSSRFRERTVIQINEKLSVEVLGIHRQLRRRKGKLKGIDTEESEWRFYVHGRAVPL